MKVLTCFLGIVFTCLTLYVGAQSPDIEALELRDLDALVDLIKAVDERQVNVIPADLDKKARDLINGGFSENRIAKFVRMAFHDCEGSGCDGCIDFTLPGNEGLENVVSLAQNFKRLNAPRLSQADVNAFLGKVAAEMGAENGGKKIAIPFRTGRKDCINMANQRSPPSGNRTDAVDFLRNEFGLTESEAVALMGAHSLGGCSVLNSGFQGQWDLTPRILDSGFYKNLRAGQWTPQRQNNAKVRSTQWVRGDRRQFVMLHADMALLKTFTTSGGFDEPSCSFSRCPSSFTATHVVSFADNDDTFLQTFAAAYTKMLHKGL